MKGSSFLRIFNVHIQAFIYFIEVQIFPINFITIVLRSIVNNNGKIVTIVLLENRVQIVLNPEVGIVVVSRHQEADGKLGRVASKIPYFIDSFPFLLLYFVLLIISSTVNLIIKASQIKALIISITPSEHLSLLLKIHPCFPRV